MTEKINNTDNAREFRTVTASTKVTELELIDLEKAAAARGVRLGEWIRGVLLSEARSSCAAVEADPHLVELVGLQMFLTRVLSSIACGDGMSRKQCQELMRNVRANKRSAARAVIAQYATEGEEERNG